MSEPLVLSARTVAAVDAHIRALLTPMLQESTQAAHDLGNAPEVHDERTWHIGRVQGLLDVLHALAPVFGGMSAAPPELADDPPAEYPLVARDGAHRGVS